ncbi:helix-turn-helix transcriptional regulator [Bifidobacterium gallicum]|nr:helix-turn-helix domain-containing protein [Bifidobacterium gallicum]
MVGLDFYSSDQLTGDAVFDLLETLGNYAPSAACEPGSTQGSVTLRVIDVEPTGAIRQAHHLLEQALGMTLQLYSVEATEWHEASRRLAEPTYPPVVSNAEIARMAHVSRQRVGQLTRSHTFPKPVIETEHTKLYRKDAVERWLETRQTKPGRPLASSVEEAKAPALSDYATEPVIRVAPALDQESTDAQQSAEACL